MSGIKASGNVLLQLRISLEVSFKPEVHTKVYSDCVSLLPLDSE